MKKTDEIEPFIINKNLGKHLDPAKTLTQTNTDGLSAVKLSQEEKYLFDIRGWILFELLPTRAEKNVTVRYHELFIGNPLLFLLLSHMSQ